MEELNSVQNFIEIQGWLLLTFFICLHNQLSSFLRPVSSMLTFPLRYNFPPLSMRITSWIVKKKSAYAEKVVRKKVELQATFFVRLVRSLINL